MQKFLNIKKEYLLIGASLLILALSYQLAFTPTIEAWQLHNSLSKRLLQASDASYQPGYLERKNRNLDKILILFKADTLNFRSNILGRISGIAQDQGVKLTEVPTNDPNFHIAGFTFEKLSFEGDYFALVKTLNKLQQTKGIGQIRSVSINSINEHLFGYVTPKIIMEIYLIISKQ